MITASAEYFAFRGHGLSLLAGNHRSWVFRRTGRRGFSPPPFTLRLSLRILPTLEPL